MGCTELLNIVYPYNQIYMFLKGTWRFLGLSVICTKCKTLSVFLTIFFFLQGFAVSLQVILSHPKAVFKRRGSQPGMQESDFLKQITTVEELEPKANNCTKVIISFLRSSCVFFGEGCTNTDAVL